MPEIALQFLSIPKNSREILGTKVPRIVSFLLSTTKTGSHLDGVIKNPTIFIDDRKIMEKGKL